MPSSSRSSEAELALEWWPRLVLLLLLALLAPLLLLEDEPGSLEAPEAEDAPRVETSTSWLEFKLLCSSSAKKKQRTINTLTSHLDFRV